MWMWKFGLDSCGCEYLPIVGNCEHDEANFGSVKGGKFDRLSD